MGGKRFRQEKIYLKTEITLIRKYELCIITRRRLMANEQWSDGVIIYVHGIIKKITTTQ